MNDGPKMNDAVDTTDCLEAVGTFKLMKNFLFLVIILCLLVTQGVFWLNFTGYVDLAEAKSDNAAAASEVPESAAKVPTGSEKAESAEDVQDTTEKQAEEAVSDLDGIAREDTAKETGSGEAEVSKTAGSLEHYIPQKSHVAAIIRICNFILIPAATLYTLVLLMSLKISLVGRLGGISHISKGFFLSLFALVILLPWQQVFSGIVVGAMFTPQELFKTWQIDEKTTMLCRGLFFARFTGMWFIVLLLEFLAQIRSARWSKTTLKRIGILR